VVLSDSSELAVMLLGRVDCPELGQVKDDDGAVSVR
jgi:hypothetical protein